MIRTHVLSAVAAMSVLAGTGALCANAADYGGAYQPNSRYTNDFADDPADDRYEARPARQYQAEDTDDASTYRPGRSWGAGNGWGRPGRHIPRIEARSSYVSDYGPREEREFRARRSAIEAWKFKVSNIYGPRFAHWRNAIGKSVECDGYRGKLSCTASARPVPGWSRWSWYGQ
jgi:hypothetical protein